MYHKAIIIEICTVSASNKAFGCLLYNTAKVKQWVNEYINKAKPTQKAQKQGVPVKNLTPAVKNLINPANKKFYGKIKFMDQSFLFS